MSHTTQRVILGKFSIAVISVTSYVVGGEPFTLAEFGLAAPLVDFFVLQSRGDIPDNTPQYLDLSTVKVNGIIRIMAVATPDQEQPTGPCSFKFLAIVQGS